LSWTFNQTSFDRFTGVASPSVHFSFVGYQYSLPFMGGTFERPEAQIKDELETLKPMLDSGTVFVSHSPAIGILDPGVGDKQIGSRSIRELLESNPFLEAGTSTWRQPAGNGPCC
jgi:Icc-related predicted phosphoesterase